MSVTPRTDTADRQTKSLGEVCSLISRGISPKYLAEGGIRVLNQRCIRDHEIEWSISRRHDDKEKRVALDRFLQFGDGLINSTGTGTLGRVAQVIDTMDEPTTVDSHVTIVRPKPGLFHAKFFGYMLIDIEDQLKDSGDGCGGQTELARSDVAEKFRVRFPSSIKEQERIASILDEAFVGIANVRANAETNLRSIFQLANAVGFPAEPIFGEKHHTLSALCEFIVDCEHKTAPTQAAGIPSIRTPNIGRGYLILDGVNRVSEATYRQWTRRAEPAEGDLIFAREAPAGNVAVVPAATKLCLGQRTVLLRPKHQIVNSRFLAHLILHPATQKRWLGHSRGATVQHVNLKDIRSLSIGALPSLEEQMNVVKRIDDLGEELGRATTVYKKQIASVEELRQSLLHQAFSGQLLKQHPRAVVISFPVTLPNISSTDLHVGVLAVAYASHEALHRASDFGHVKAEKIAHMVEAYVGVDLGRAPIRDAAGPNDFPHLKKIEHRADKAGYLTFARQPSGAYRVTKKAGFDSLVAKTRTALGDRNQDLDKLLNLMTPMTTKQAEIFATVYAAWNNLLMDGEHVTDERIVRAAREDWHGDKLNIPRDKFFTAIEWIRTKGICPEGRGKRVEPKGPTL